MAKPLRKPPANPLYGAPARFSTVTYAPKGMLDRPKDNPVRLRWFADNCEALADFMESLQPERHMQSTWNTQSTPRARQNACGTAACAMGWAAFSQIIPGLQYTLSDAFACGAHPVTLPEPFEATIEGEPYSFGYAGAVFFGDRVRAHIFNNGWLSKKQVVELLRSYAKRYRAEADR